MAGYKKKVEDLRNILRLSEIFAERNIDKVLTLLARQSCEIIGAERASIFLIDEATNELWSRVALESEIGEIRVPVGTGIVGFVAQTGQTLSIKDAYSDPRFNKEIDKKTGFRTRNMLCTPLVNKQGKIIGVLQVINKKKNGFSKYHEDVIKLFASFATLVVENATLLYEQELMMTSFFKTLAATIDAKDKVTKGHSERVTKYALNLAKACGFSQDELKKIEYAATLHDIGKIGVRDNVLLKPGLLTPEEFAEMKMHVVKTREILENIYLPRYLANLVHTASSHHERLNGSGYPSGLKGDQISKAARILCIADVYDALTSYDRPYKRAMSHEEAKKVLLNGKGELFDPELVDLFFEKKLYLIDIREFHRVNADLTVEYSYLNEAELQEATTAVKSSVNGSGKTLNISPGGLLFTSKTDIPVGVYLRMVLHFVDKQFPVIAKVVRSERAADNSFRLGVRFINVDQSLLKRLERFLRDFGEEREEAISTN